MNGTVVTMYRDLGSVPAQPESASSRLPSTAVEDMLRSNGAKPSAHLLETDAKKEIAASRDRIKGALESGDNNAALKEYAKIISLDPSNANVHVERANLLLTQGYPGGTPQQKMRDDVQLAIVDYTKAIEIEPNNKDYFVGRAVAKCYAGAVKDTEYADYRGAASDLSKAIQLDPSNGGLYQERAFAKGKLGQFDDAIKDMNKVIELDPKNGGSYLARGDVYVSAGKVKEAYADYHEALKVNPKDPEPWTRLSAARAQAGDIQGCLEDGTKYLIAIGNQECIRSGIHGLLKAAQEYRSQGDDKDADFAMKLVAELAVHTHKREHFVRFGHD